MRSYEKSKALLHKIATGLLDSSLPLSTGYGICESVRTSLESLAADLDEFEAVDGLLAYIIDAWPRNSGREVFPVPGARGKDPAAAYVDAVANGTLWSKRSAYGRARWELLQYIADKTKE
jgi:hypothetical protein